MFKPRKICNYFQIMVHISLLPFIKLCFYYFVWVISGDRGWWYVENDGSLLNILGCYLFLNTDSADMEWHELSFCVERPTDDWKSSTLFPFCCVLHSCTFREDQQTKLQQATNFVFLLLVAVQVMYNECQSYFKIFSRKQLFTEKYWL